MAEDNRKDVKEVNLDEIESPNRKLYWRRVKQGLCTYCGTKLSSDVDGRKCRECQDELNKRKRERYRRRKEQERCVLCNEDISDFERSETYCKECLEKNRGEGWSMDAKKNFREWNLEKLQKQLDKMPEYLVEQFFKGLEDIEEAEKNGERSKDDD